MEGLKIEEMIKIYSTRTRQNIQSLKPLQQLAINNILKGQDTIALLPTSCGKSLIYELLPCISHFLCIVLVLLNAIIDQQAKKLGNRCEKIITKRHFIIGVDEAHWNGVLNLGLNTRISRRS